LCPATIAGADRDAERYSNTTDGPTAQTGRGWYLPSTTG